MNRLEEVATGLLVNADVEVGSARRLVWHLPFELIDDFFATDQELKLLGIPVTIEALLGEETIVLTETIGVGTVSRETANGQ